MKKMRHCLLLLVILSAACNGPQIKWPKVTECIVSVKASGAACICDNQSNDDGPVILPIKACDGFMAVSPEDYSTLYDFSSDITERLEICLRFPKKCQ
jgi:hypothetical protein